MEEEKKDGWMDEWIDGCEKEWKSFINNLGSWFTCAKWIRKGEMAVI